ncbi:hypothetical protein FB567DRAFT_21465 [Paraphoma chrysanthemicola]|uniref:Uncharacterized protein n=1 Tax=Paraphoma chrysanthemicola TaxID=798071 RepID=A0A8K0RJW8_9PLEO|nr:hypothetical protein FB567DRAFT_21465 [Paraphoma chrysanthemicola]
MKPLDKIDANLAALLLTKQNGSLQVFSRMVIAFLPCQCQFLSSTLAIVRRTISAFFISMIANSYSGLLLDKGWAVLGTLCIVRLLIAQSLFQKHRH